MIARVSLQLLLLSVCVAVLGVAAMLRVAPESTDQVVLGGWTLPELCQSKRLFQMNCPGCGLTRSFIYMAHGEFLAALRIHAVGALMFVGVLILIPFFAANSIIIARGGKSLVGEQAIGWLVFVNTILLLAHWLVRPLVAY